MYKMLKSTTYLVATLVMATPVLAGGPLQNYASQLAEQGYTNIEISRTMLGRGKIEATKGNITREIVVSASGRVLSDETGARIGGQPAAGQDSHGISQTKDDDGEDGDDGDDGEDGDDGDDGEDGDDGDDGED